MRYCELPDQWKLVAEKEEKAFQQQRIVDLARQEHVPPWSPKREAIRQALEETDFELVQDEETGITRLVRKWRWAS